MPLHLLGKKSWNVYNANNIARVRRDEAEAQAREEAEEQRMQQIDAQRRTALLKGEKPDLTFGQISEAVDRSASHDIASSRRKRRRLRGEDETDREIRYVREDAAAAAQARVRLLESQRHDDDSPLFDRDGHLQLIPEPDEKSIGHASKVVDTATRRGRKRDDEAPLNVHLRDAISDRNGKVEPWYAATRPSCQGNSQDPSGNFPVLSDVQNKDVWGNADPRREEREGKRLVSNDPLGAMMQAQRQLKQSASERERWKRDRMAELEPHRSRSHRVKDSSGSRHSRKDLEYDGLEDGFQLEDSGGRHGTRHERRDQLKRHRRRRSRSPTREQRQNNGDHSKR